MGILPERYAGDFAPAFERLGPFEPIDPEPIVEVAKHQRREQRARSQAQQRARLVTALADTQPQMRGDQACLVACQSDSGWQDGVPVLDRRCQKPPLGQTDRRAMSMAAIIEFASDPKFDPRIGVEFARLNIPGLRARMYSSGVNRPFNHGLLSSHFTFLALQPARRWRLPRWSWSGLRRRGERG